MNLKIQKKILPQSYTLNTAQKPMHAGEISLLILDVRGVGTATTNEAIRGVFVELKKELDYGLHKIAFPQLEKIEMTLKIFKGFIMEEIDKIKRLYSLGKTRNLIITLLKSHLRRDRPLKSGPTIYCVVNRDI